jgi:hypothetical protein
MENYHKNKTYFKIADANHGMYHSELFKTEDEARTVIENDYKNRSKNDGYDEYWRNRNQIVIKVTEDILG